MAYILNKTNGTVLVTVEDGSIDNQTTDLTFVGRNFAGYGEIQNENFLKLLENFAHTDAPSNPILGQIWFDALNNVLNVYDGTYWKNLAQIEVSTTDPTGTKNYKSGDLWYDSEQQQLSVYNGTEFILVGPPSNADALASWKGSYEYSTATQISYYNIKAVVGEDNGVVAILSNDAYIVEKGHEDTTYPVSELNSPGNFYIAKGITLAGADPVTGNSANNGYYLWGSARHAVSADLATSSTYANGFAFKAVSDSGKYHVPFLSTSSGYVGSTASISLSFFFTPSTNVLNVTATAAQYSDLAERYHADDNYGHGTVMVIGGHYEVTISSKENDTRVAGIVSTKPAFRMNDDAGDHQTHPFIALKGRLPCKVTGSVYKGDLLVTSNLPGHGRSFRTGDSPNAVFARALEDHLPNGSGMIEVMVV